MGAKRRRLALSCVACRRRKVKCGREVPSCVRCVRGGHGHSCSYVQDEEKSHPGLPTPTDESPEEKRDASPCQSWTDDAEHWQRSSAAVNQNTINSNSTKRRAPPQTLEQRFLELEQLTKPPRSTQGLGDSLPGRSQSAVAEPQPHEDGIRSVDRSLLRGRSFKTQYFGPSHATSLLLQFEELSCFARDILRSTTKFIKFKDHFKDSKMAIPFATEAEEDSDLRALVNLVPSKDRTDVFVAEYFDTYETTYRVLHTPTFTREYEQFWSDDDSARDSFVVQLLLVCASVIWAVPGESEAFVGRSSVNRERASTWIKTAEAWLGKQSDKHTSLEFYQTHLLLIIAKRNVCYKVKRDWTTTGNVLRRAMVAGLHRDPAILSDKISVFDQEMRRRIWYTIVELEAQASCSRGMRAALSADDWDCPPPLNIHDEDFNETTQVLPSALPTTTWTRTSFLASASKHVALRLEMLNAINSLSSEAMTLPTIMKYDSLTRAALDSLPQNSSAGSTKPVPYFSSMVSRLLLHEFLLLLHQPFATSSLSESRHFYSRCARRDSALNILGIYTSPKLPLTQRLILSNLHDANLRACLSTCHDIVVASHKRGSCVPDMTHDRGLSVDYLRMSVELFAMRVKRLGQGFHGFWLTSSALALVQSLMNPDEPVETYIREATDRVLKLQDEIIAVQLPGYTPAGTGKRQSLQERQETASDTASAEAEAAGGANGAIPAVQGQSLSDGGGAETGGQMTTGGEINLGLDGANFAVDGFTPFDPFAETVFDFDNFGIWNMELSAG